MLRPSVAKFLGYRNHVNEAMGSIVACTEVIVFDRFGVHITLNSYNEHGEPYSTVEMADSLITAIESRYTFEKGNRVVKREKPIDEEKVAIMIALQRTNYPSAIAIPPLVMGAEPTKAVRFTEAPEMIHSFVKAMDMENFARLTGYSNNFEFFQKKIWKVPNEQGVYSNPIVVKPDGTKEIESLSTLVYRKLSMYNYAFTGCKHGRYVRNSLANMGAGPVLEAARKLSVNTHLNRSVKLPLHATITAAAVSTNLKKSGLDKLQGKFSGEIAVGDIVAIEMKGSKAGGQRANNGKNQFITIEDPDNPNSRIDFYANSNKADQEFYAKNMLLWAVQSVVEHDIFPDIQNFYKAVFKEELNVVMTDDPVEHASLDVKARVFYVADTFTTGLSELFNKNRIVNDRSTTLNGMKLTAGGGHKHFLRIGGKIVDGKPVVPEGYHWRECDGKWYDLVQHVEDIVMYCWESLNLIDENSPWYRVQRKLCEEVIRRITVKPTQFYGEHWFLIYGKVASGIKETASLDSWLMKIHFWRFFWYVYYTHPDRQEEMDKWAENDDFMVVASGDDNQSKCPDAAYDILNMKLFGEFLSKYYNMEIRSVYDKLPLLSVPDALGNLSVRGVSIVKSYLIETPAPLLKYYADRKICPSKIPAVVFYVKTSDVYQKLFNVKNGRESLPEYYLKFICAAYRSGGVNFVLYDMCKKACDYLKNKMIAQNTDLKKHFDAPENRQRMEEYLYKYGVSFGEVMSGFPTYFDLWDKQLIDYTSDFEGSLCYQGPRYDQDRETYVANDRYVVPERIMDAIVNKDLFKDVVGY